MTPRECSPTDGPVALVIQQRIADADSETYAMLLSRIATRLRNWPGFTRQEVVAPNPPTQVDWIEIEYFSSAESARLWLQSGERAILLADARQYVVGQEDLQLLSDTSRGQARVASVMISHRVEPEDEGVFLSWQHDIQAAEARFKGFLRHKIERPLPGVQSSWVTIVAFDCDANLENWLNSSERAALLMKGDKFQRSMTVRRNNYGFDFWFSPDDRAPEDKHVIMKQNMVVLLVLYPVVYLWGYFIGGPLLDARHAPPWLSLFIGNLISTQLLGWWIAPWAFNKLEWWMKPDASTGWNIAGYALVILLYGASMALYAVLLGGIG
ncbi:antibiotic biosynthesis monooxygenase [Methylocystis echinoides]|jgi:antibiotic biosynthesis monooxygenase (ABM) superfamily enzyme|uniref:antibiotic biosynthesis monooxygenase n=1 Tax=Methylocystis echinoides TaxID=29468 RepID=UPI00342C36F2